MRVFGTGNSPADDPYQRKFNALLEKARRVAGVPQVSCHDLRRTVARLANEAGASAKDLKEMLGHSSFATTMTYIGKEQEDASRRAHEALVRRDRWSKSGNKSVTATGAPADEARPPTPLNPHK